MAKWPVSKSVELELGQRLLPKAAQRTEIQDGLSQPARKSQGSRTNRSQRAKNKAKAKVKEERSQREQVGSQHRDWWVKASLSQSRWPIRTGVGVWGLNRMRCPEGPMTDWLPWSLDKFSAQQECWNVLTTFWESHFSEVIRKVTNHFPQSQTPSEVRWLDLRISHHLSHQPTSL